MKKVLKCLAASALIGAVITTASCKKGDNPTGSTDGGSVASNEYVKGDLNNGTVELSVHYTNSGYHFTPSYQGTSQVTGIGGESLVKGNLLPTWSAIAKNLNGTIVDKTAVDFADAKTEWKNYNEKGFGGIDLIMVDGMGSSNGYTAAANSGKLQDIGSLIDEGKLPNFKIWLDSQGGYEGAMWNSMKAADGKVYFLPYFDGLNNVEKVWLMNPEYIEKILDSDNTNGMNEAAAVGNNVGGFQAAVPSMSNEVLNLGDNKTVTVNYTKSVITKQNELSTKNGKSYAEVLRQHIDDVYGANIGSGKLYSKRSEIFTSQYACYNADDLIALMRCVVNNASYLTNGKQKTMYAFVPRTGEGNRLKQMAEFMNIWGQRGVSAESGKLYFDSDGKLHDARTELSTYDNLDRMNALYNEGFFPSTFIKGYGDQVKTEWRSNCIKAGNVFSLYDYTTTSSASNQDVQGPDKSASNLIPMLPAVVKWDDGDNSTGYFHFSEDNRSLKTNGWSIPKTADVDNACKVADYIWCPEGADLQDYGPNTTDYRTAVTEYDEHLNRVAGAGTFNVNGSPCVKWSEKVINKSYGDGSSSDSFKANWNNFIRKYVGSTQGIGHVRSAGNDVQVTLSQKAQDGIQKINNAITAGGMVVARTDGGSHKTNLFYYSVPTGFSLTAADTTAIQNEAANTTVDNFWKDDSSANGKVVYCYWIIEGKSGTNVTAVTGSFDSFKGLFERVNNTYLKACQEAYYRK